MSELSKKKEKKKAVCTFLDCKGTEAADTEVIKVVCVVPEFEIRFFVGEFLSNNRCSPAAQLPEGFLS